MISTLVPRAMPGKSASPESIRPVLDLRIPGFTLRLAPE